MMIEIDKSNKLVLASETGKNHLDSGLVNQDRIAYRKMIDGFVLALSDGVSSARYSDVGAEVAVETIVSMVSGTSFTLDSSANVDDIKKSIVRMWKSHFKSDWDDYAATLNFVAQKNHVTLIGQIGDGLMLVKANGCLKKYGEEEDFYTTETYALGTAVYKKTFLIEVMDNVKSLGLAIMSDGIGKELDTDHLLDMAESLYELLDMDEEDLKREMSEWMEKLNGCNGDDKTIGILIWEAE